MPHTQSQPQLIVSPEKMLIQEGGRNQRPQDLSELVTPYREARHLKTKAVIGESDGLQSLVQLSNNSSRVKKAGNGLEYYKVQSNPMNFLPTIRFERDLSQTMPGGRKIKKQTPGSKSMKGFDSVFTRDNGVGAGAGKAAETFET